VGLKLVFFGTPELARTVLRGIVDSPHEILGVVTNPDRPSGRGRKTHPGPVAELARESGLELVQPETLRDPGTQARLREFDADVFAVAACGFILPEAVLEMPRLAPVNAHASVLPALRGAAPIERAILEGLHETGVTIQRMVREVDAGDVYAVRRTPIGPRETAASLRRRLAGIAAELLREVLTKIEAGEITPESQDESRVTYAPRLTREDRAIRWSEAAVAIDRRVRAFSPSPGAFAFQPEELGGKLIKIIEAEAHTDATALHKDRQDMQDRERQTSCPSCASLSDAVVRRAPGEVLAASDHDGLVVAAGEGAVRLVTVQPEGKRAMDAAAYLRGHRLSVGMRFLGGVTHARG
jgi:methionyl-tRNA formyltransferase